MHIIKLVFIHILIIINFFPCLSQKNDAVSRFESLKIFSNANISICVQNMEGKDIVSFNKNKSLSPASILKIITTATSLEYLGDNFVFKTELAMYEKDNNKLVIKGYGDPTLGSEHLFTDQRGFLTEWIQQIKNNLRPPINIEINDEYFGYKGVSDKWIREDMGNYYAAGAYGISIFDNTYRLFLNTMNTGETPHILRTDPPIKNLVLLNSLSLNSNGRDNGFIWGEPFSNKRILTGNIPAKRSSFSIKGDIPDPGLLLGEILADSLKANGIKINNLKTAREDYYTVRSKISQENSMKTFYTHISPPLKDIIRIINVKSNNHYAEHLIRAIGKTKNPDKYSDALDEGINAVKNFWQSKGMDINGLFMYDGCGLSPSNSVNSVLMCDILRYMYKQSKHSEPFLASFPKAGEEGTVRNFLKGTKLQGKLLVKSGSIENVQCYAGYYVEGKKQYVFTVMVNNYSKNSRAEARKAIERLLIEIF